MGPDGQKSRIGKNEYTLGSTFTCNYANFGLSPSDLEYKEEKSTEDKLAMITAGIEMGIGLLNTGLQIAETVKTSRQLKEKSRYMHDAWYKFDGTNLTVVTDKIDVEYKYGPKGKKKELEEDTTLQCLTRLKESKTDEEGSYYNACWMNDDKIKSKHPDGGEECNEKTTLCESTGNPDGCVEACYTYIEKATEIKVAEKLSELMRSIGDLESKRKASERAQGRINMMTQAEAYDSANSFNNTSGRNNGTKNYCYAELIYERLSIPDQAIDKITQKKTEYTTTYCRLYDGGRGWSCLNIEDENFDKCKSNFDNSTGHWYYYENSPESESMVDKLTQQYAAEDSKKTNTLDEWYEGQDKIVSDYTKTLNTYNTNQTKLNEAKKEMEELREKSNSSITNIASQATQTLMGSGMTLMTTAIAANQKKGTMTGMCYLGDPKNGGTPLTNEGEAKKLTWKLFYD